jgi:ectoine hydroxylase-related dioxygenase (phytanoyl-CoA dioxygenase family)
MIRIDCQGLSEDGLSGSEQVRQAYDCLVRNGYAILDRLLPEATVAALQRAFVEQSGHLLNEAPEDEALEVGNRRNLFALPFTGAFADPLVWANPVVVALARLALADEAVLESWGVVVSLPGAERQHFHRDGPGLFDSAISPLLPAHALTVAFPLVEMNETNGTTALWPGSHRWQKTDKDAPSFEPVVAPGSAMLWDFRTYHSGTANNSAEPRPLITATFSRRWYQDPVNFEQGSRRRLALDDAFLAGVPARTRSLFAHLSPG